MSVSEAQDPLPSAAADGHGRAVPLLLAIAAVVAAIVTARAALLASDATILWGQSIGDEQRRGAILQESARYTYGPEGGMAFMLLSAQVRAEELQKAAEGQPSDVATRLSTEAQVQQSLVDLIGPDQELFADPRYRLPSGALNVELRLADDRTHDDLAMTLDPLAKLEAGDEAAERSDLLMLCTVVVATAFLFGALAQALRGQRRPLLVLGWVVLVIGGAAAIAIELGAAGTNA